MSTHPVLVIGSSGNVGREVVPALLARGARVRVLVRHPDRVTWPADVEVVAGDLRDPESVRRALVGVRSAFYVSPHEVDEEALAATFIAACEEAGVRLVFAGVDVVATNAVTRMVRRAMLALFLPWYGGKLAVARAIERSRTNPVVFALTNFMQNDDTFADEIRAGHFVVPLAAKGVNRVDLRDVAELVARALTEPDFPSGSYVVVGPESLSGEQCARIWSEQLERPVRYTGDDDAEFQAALDRHLTGQKRIEWGKTFRVLRRMALHARPDEVAQTAALLGHAPRDYAGFVADRAVTWRALSR
jgi:uncharacterized protein YbjT (DUF2867 family)